MSDNNLQFCDLLVITRELVQLMRGKMGLFRIDNFASIVFCSIL